MAAKGKARRRRRDSAEQDPAKRHRGRLACACRKTGYRSEGSAREALARIHEHAERRGPRTTTPANVYQCPLSGWWHLTSRTA